MTKTIAFLNSKGGCGKTTSSILTALALSNMGYRVEVRDSDPSGGAYMWGRKARERNEALPFDVLTVGERNLGEPSAKKLDFIIIDTPPVVNKTLADAVEAAADLVVIVSKPGELDEDRTQMTTDALSKSTDFSVLLTFASPSYNSTKTALKQLEQSGVGRFETIIPQRESTHTAAGTNHVPTDSGYIDAAMELVAYFK